MHFSILSKFNLLFFSILFDTPPEKDYPSTWAAITAIAPKIGCTPETLRAWHQKHLDQQNPIKVQQISDQEKMRQMEREIKELKRANEILRKAAAFFAQAELDRPHK